MYDYEKALEDKKFKLKDYILFPFAGLGFIFFLSIIFLDKANLEYSFITPAFMVGKTIKEAYLLQSLIILGTFLIVGLLYSQVLIRLEKNEKIPLALVDLAFLIVCVLPIFIMFYSLGIAQTLTSDAQRKAITIILTMVILRIREIYRQVKINKKVNQRLKKTGQ